ncbi:hypothetical protein DPM13_00760 [Paracoccus mutanolyticus]|uniref:Uncharacterized protein n=1 Tax=Paracoccus mutanolyticus TaxID=1499308 RepID=A0ABM6WNY1_9RHOB|nr:hypothetical protein [Paracoccus mutanolyticus]AWX92308.1 hypothetical protein DPM13_00760 [Paracoccus mutanolyticus]
MADEIRGKGGRAHASAGDIGLPETHARLVAEAIREFGGLDDIANAGTAEYKHFMGPIINRARAARIPAQTACVPNAIRA